MPGYGELFKVRFCFSTKSGPSFLMLSNLCISRTVTYETSVNANCSGCMHDQFASDRATSDHRDDTHDPSTLSDRR